MRDRRWKDKHNVTHSVVRRMDYARLPSIRTMVTRCASERACTRSGPGLRRDRLHGLPGGYDFSRSMSPMIRLPSTGLTT